MKKNLIKILSAFLAVVLVISIAPINSGAYLNDITKRKRTIQNSLSLCRTI